MSAEQIEGEKITYGNVAGNYNAVGKGAQVIKGDKITYGNVTGSHNAIGEGAQVVINQSISAIDWEKIDFTLHLERARFLFVEHMRSQINEFGLEDALNHYEPLNFSAIKSSNLDGGSKISESFIGSWEEQIQHPCQSLLVGEAGGGKTTQLLNHVHILANQATEDPNAPLPIYLPLTTFYKGNTNTLLDMAAYTAGQEPSVLHALWRSNSQRPLFLMLDGADEVPELYISDLINAIDGLLNAAPLNHHSLIITSRPGRFQAKLQQELPENFRDVTLLQLNDSQISSLLTKHQAAKLDSILSQNQALKSVMRTPGGLTTLASAVNETQKARLPTNIGKIYQIHIDDNLFKNPIGFQYDYLRVQQPILAWLAFVILSQEKISLRLDDALYDQLATRLNAIQTVYERRQIVMPTNWNAQHFLEELVQCPVLNNANEPEPRLWFNNRIYLDYFAALYLAKLDTTSSELEAVVSTFKLEDSIDPFIFLIGFQPDAEAKFNKLFENWHQRAADLWFERQPYGIEAPSSIQTYYEAKLANIASSPQAQVQEPVTYKLLVQMLNSNDPSTRLKAAGALTQWGASGIDGLLFATQDDHPFIRSVAKYALLHLGEWLPPLIEADDGVFRFRSSGGCNAIVGPLNLVQVPDNVIAELDLTIANLDFNPFEVESDFECWHTSSAWLAASWFNKERTVDWMGLITRFQWIIENTMKVIHIANSLPSLANFVTRLQYRVAEYDRVGQKLARNFGLAWQPIESIRISDQINEIAEEAYQQLRYSYSLTKRSQFLELGQELGDSVNVSQLFEHVEDRATVIGGKAAQIFLEVPDALKQTEKFKFSKIEMNQSIEINEGSVTNMIINKIIGAKQQIPITLFLNGSIAIEEAINSNIVGLEIETLEGGKNGVRAAYHVHIENFESSTFTGIEVRHVI